MVVYAGCTKHILMVYFYFTIISSMHVSRKGDDLAALRISTMSEEEYNLSKRLSKRSSHHAHQADVLSDSYLMPRRRREATQEEGKQNETPKDKSMLPCKTLHSSIFSLLFLAVEVIPL